LYLSISPAYPPTYYTDPVPLVRAQEEYADEISGGFLKWFAGEIDLRNKSILDLGSGYGGRTVRYKELGASRSVGVEIAPAMVKEGIEFAKSKSADVEFVVGVGEDLSFPDNSFDIITSYDVFEHVENVHKVLDECCRVLRSGGILYAVFPPFYHPTGSHLDGFASKMPYANLLFSPKALMTAATAILEERGDRYRPSALRPHDKLWSLNGVTVKGFRRMVKSTGFSRSKVTYAPLFSPMNSKWRSWRMKYYACLFKPLRTIPLVQELFVHRIVCQLTK
jgi:SAM-dependent methyltransferase